MNKSDDRRQVLTVLGIILVLSFVPAFLVLFTQLAGGNTRGKVMSIGPNPGCCHLNPLLLEHYEQARFKFPSLLDQLNHHLTYGKPFGDDFKPNFNRG